MFDLIRTRTAGFGPSREQAALLGESPSAAAALSRLEHVGVVVLVTALQIWRLGDVDGGPDSHPLLHVRPRARVVRVPPHAAAAACHA